MRVTIVSPGFDGYSVSLCRALSARGQDVTLFTGSLEELPNTPVDFRIRRVFDVGNVRRRTWPTPLRKLSNGVAVLWGLSMMAVESMVRRPAIAHLQGGMYASGFATLCLCLMRLTGARVVYTPHNTAGRFRSKFERFWWILQLRLPHAVLVHSQIARDRLMANYGAQMRRVAVVPFGDYNIIAAESPRDKGEARRICGIPESDVVGLVFGHLRGYKGLDLAIQALASVAKSHPNARLLVAGREAESVSPYRSMADELGLTSRILWHIGWIKPADVWVYFVASDFVLAPYRDSGEIDSSAVVALAHSFCRPVIATDVGGIAFQVGNAGILVPPDDVQALAQAWRVFTEDTALAVELSTRASLRGQSDSWREISEATAMVYSQLLLKR